MQGQSERLSESEVVPCAWEYRFLTDSLVPLRNPVGEDITHQNTQGYLFVKGTVIREWLEHHTAGSACYGHTNLVPACCRAYIQATGREVTAVHIAKGSTQIAYWLPEGAGHSILLEKTAAAKKKVNPDRIWFVWLQGESDALASTSKECYKESLVRLMASLKELGVEKFGIIRVGRFAGDERDDAVLDAQCEICRENPDFVMLTTLAEELFKDPRYMNPAVRGHFSAEGLETLGSAAGEALARLVL